MVAALDILNSKSFSVHFKGVPIPSTLKILGKFRFIGEYVVVCIRIMGAKNFEVDFFVVGSDCIELCSDTNARGIDILVGEDAQVVKLFGKASQIMLQTITLLQSKLEFGVFP